jgi:hypothetical protein
VLTKAPWYARQLPFNCRRGLGQNVILYLTS